MNNKKIYDIHERIYRWVITVINFTKRLPRTQHNYVIIPQITDSVTSVGANDQEADASNSKKDFIAKYSISRKECKETIYWLRILKEINPDEYNKEADFLISEGHEIGCIISSIMNKAKNNPS